MEESNLLLDIFPPEVWTLILDSVKNPTELWNVINADPLFRLLCKAKEDIWMSTLVGLTFPKLYPYQTKRDILNYRRVCKRLKSSVDTYLEAGHSRRNFPYDDRYNILGKVILRLENSLYCQQMVEEMRMFPEAKIVGRAVATLDFENNFAERSFPFFLESGQKILHLHLSQSPLRGTPLRLLTLIRQTLETTPNLKSLLLHFDNIAANELGVPHRLWVDRVDQMLQETPLPALPNLTSLELLERVRFQWNGGVIVHQRILEAYKGQVQKLYLLGVHVYLPQGMGRLTDLSIHVKYVFILESLKNLRAPLLSKLCLYFDQNNLSVRYGDIFPVLQSVKSTLKELTLLGGCTNDGGFVSAEQNQLQFPVLEKLQINDKCASYCTSYDFLLGMPSLRELTLRLEVLSMFKSFPLIGNGNLELIVYFNNDGTLNQDKFKECTIWNLLPSLQKVHIKKSWSTRVDKSHNLDVFW